MRTSLATFTFSVLGVGLAGVFGALGCSSFGSFGSTDVQEPPEPSPEPGPPVAENTSTSTLKSGALGPEIACGYQTACGGGTGCCVTTKGPSCTNACDDGFLFQCGGPSDCAAGQTCCMRGNVATCATSCDDGALTVCEDTEDCGAGQTCNPERCGGTYSTAICRRIGLERQELGCGPETIGVSLDRNAGKSTPTPSYPTPVPGPSN